ncbi:hypothetical protein ACTVZO_07425 [Streptomyces sp. IBSNAI002]|uniref:hypothetical protein n=1 Tax=Streptomyces sp. IBSNAI002 TaxID=3457500 RepID=UPI003FD58632
MRAFVIHDKHGNVVSVTTHAVDAPPIEFAPGPGRQGGEVEYSEDFPLLTGAESEERLAGVLAGLRVDVPGDGSLVRGARPADAD